MTTYTQQQLVDLYKKLFPQITEDSQNVQITLKGQTFTFSKPKESDRPATVTSIRNISYR